MKLLITTTIINILQTDIILENISFAFFQGDLVLFICSGNGSDELLIRSLTGMLEKVEGKSLICGQVSFTTTKDPWIQATTIKENILFGKPFDKIKYKQAIKSSGLDLLVFPFGDSTETGELGCNLTFEQRWKVGLARSIYSESDIYLFDGILDDDSNSANEESNEDEDNNEKRENNASFSNTFENCVFKQLEGKTKIISITSATAFSLSKSHQRLFNLANHVFIIEKGKISVHGTYSQILSNQEFSHIFHHQHQHFLNDSSSIAEILPKPSPKKTPTIESASTKPNEVNPTTTVSTPNINPNYPIKASTPSVMSEEEGIRTITTNNDGVIGETTTTTTSAWKTYLKSIGIAAVNAICLVFGISVICHTSLIYLVSLIIDFETRLGPPISVESLMVIYVILAITAVLGIIIRTLLFSYGTTRGSAGVHDKALAKLLRGTMNFFTQKTSIAKIMGLFGDDSAQIDISIGISILDFIGTLFGVCATLILSTIVLPFLLPFVFPFVWLFVNIQERNSIHCAFSSKNISKAVSNLKRRITEITDSGVITICTSTRQLRRINSETEMIIDDNFRATQADCAAHCWNGIRIDFLSGLVIFITGILATSEQGKVHSVILTLPILCGLYIYELLPQISQSRALLHLSIMPVQRMVKLIGSVPQETPLLDKDATFIPSYDWPCLGKITFRNYYYYSQVPDRPPIFTNLTFNILPGERIGIIGGRNNNYGAITETLLRLSASPTAVRGSILIDDVDIANVALMTLRSRICSIPRDQQSLFKGTLKWNLIGFENDSNKSNISDDEILTILSKTRLNEIILQKIGTPTTGASSERILDFSVEENGNNFSACERQLVLIARGLINHSNVFVIDEATTTTTTTTTTTSNSASTNVSTNLSSTSDMVNDPADLEESNFHHAIFSSCGKATVIVAVHRIQTALKCDRIVMLDSHDGSIVSIGSPSQFLLKESANSSLLIDLVNQQNQSTSTSFQLPISPIH